MIFSAWQERRRWRGRVSPRRQRRRWCNRPAAVPLAGAAAAARSRTAATVDSASSRLGNTFLGPVDAVLVINDRPDINGAAFGAAFIYYIFHRNNLLSFLKDKNPPAEKQTINIRKD